jgi:iron complex outermembrane receptor protein
MMLKHQKTALALSIAVATLVAPGFSSVAFGAEEIEEVVVTGTRRAARSATDSPVPVDVFSGSELQNQGTSDMDDLLRTLVPSYNVGRQSISDAATVMRPASLRGLPPDDTLILVNGKRRHRGAVIAELGGSLTAGSQGPDVSVIPSIALKQVEILRDGASAQYGSDAIAGVLNFILKDASEGVSFEVKTGEYYEGDGELLQFAGNIGLPLGNAGFFNASIEYKTQDATSRSIFRSDVDALRAAGNLAVPAIAQIWGAPELDDDWKFFYNSAIELSSNVELYSWGNYAERKVTGGFFFRNPNGRGGIFTNGDGNRLVFDTTATNGLPNGTGNCPGSLGSATPSAALIPPDLSDPASVAADNAALAALAADPNCFVRNEVDPGGYTPSFGAQAYDYSEVVGIRGELKNGTRFDVSGSYGVSDAQFFLNQTNNNSQGPDNLQTAFRTGDYTQSELNFNADFSREYEIASFYSPLNVAVGGEYRKETFEITQGEEASWIAGRFAAQGGNIGSHGFAGFSPVQTGVFDRGNLAVYVDLEADVTEQLLLNAAVRFEKFEDFGTTTNFKGAFAYKFTDTFVVRASASTGFRAPTPGQSNVTKVSTRTDLGTGNLIQSGQIPPSNPIAQFLGAKDLDAEEATNISVGFTSEPIEGLTLTADYFWIELEDRIATTSQISIDSGLAAQLEAAGIPGATDFSSVAFYTNGFETTTRGVDLVATYAIDSDMGHTDLAMAWNWTKTEVEDFDPKVIRRDRIVDLEEYNPRNRINLSANHSVGDMRFLVRASYYDEFVVADTASGPASSQCVSFSSTSRNPSGTDECFGDEWIIDVEAAYTFNDAYTVVIGAQNVFDTDAGKDFDSGTGNSSGQKFTSGSPFGSDGGFWYARFLVDF